MNKLTFLLMLLVGQLPLMVMAQSDTAGIRRYLALAGDLKQQNKFEEAAPYYEKALALLRAKGDKQAIAAVLPDYSEVKAQQGQLPAAEEMLEESIRLSKELGIGRLQWQYGFLGAIQIQRRESVEALKNELEAIKIGEQYADTSAHMAEIYNYAAIMYSKMGRLDESGQYVRKAIATGSYSRDPMLTVQFRSNLADVLIRQNKPREALDDLLILEKAYGTDMQLNARIQILSRFLRCYSELKDSAGAERSANQLIKHSDNMRPDEYDQLAVYTQLNRYLIASGQFEKAKRFVEQQRLAAEKFKIPDQRMQAFYYRSQIDSATGDMAAALHNYQLYARIKDSANSVNIANQLNQLHIEYETEKKDKALLLQKSFSDKRSQELALNHQALVLKARDLLTERQHVDLLTKQAQLQNAASQEQQQRLLVNQKNIQLLQKSNRLQEMELEKAAFIRDVIIAGSFGLALMSLLVYSRYRMKKRSSEELALQREQIREKNVSLQALINDKDKLLAEKQWLVKEVHHRVKNNLQMVISLLNSQSAYLSSQDAVAAIKESQRRMQAMSLIHQRLYEKDDSSIDMLTYISELVSHLKDSFDCEQVRFVLDLDFIELDVSKAVPVGLILNEAITNSLKYAFPDGRPGQILISLKPVPPLVELIVADDGVGLPTDNLTGAKKSLGMSLLKGLTLQIGGTYELRSQRGVEIAIRFSAEQIGKSTLKDA
jgi:two-component sensor histidine kinase